MPDHTEAPESGSNEPKVVCPTCHVTHQGASAIGLQRRLEALAKKGPEAPLTSNEQTLCRFGALPHPHFHIGGSGTPAPERFSVVYGVGREFQHFRSCPDGGWTYYGNYESLRSELDRQRAEVEQLRTLLRIARDEWYDDNGQWGDGFGLKHWTRKADALLSDESSFRETEQHRE